MKKAFSVFAALILIFAAGCEKQAAPESDSPALPESFTANLRVDYGDASMTALFAQKSFEEYEIRMLTPEILSPLILTYTNGVCTVTYDGLKFEADPDRFPQVSFGTLLIQTISDVKDGIDIQSTYADGIRTYKGTGERGVFVITQDEKTGNWLELSVEGAQLHVIFTDFKNA